MIPGIAFVMTLRRSVAAAARSIRKAAAAFIVTLQPPARSLSLGTISDADWDARRHPIDDKKPFRPR
jgi:hypothetical protein